jgi:hypothetical protein
MNSAASTDRQQRKPRNGRSNTSRASAVTTTKSRGAICRGDHLAGDQREAADRRRQQLLDRLLLLLRTSPEDSVRTTSMIRCRSPGRKKSGIAQLLVEEISSSILIGGLRAGGVDDPDRRSVLSPARW